MEIKDVLTLIVAVYGAILATFLGIRELRKERRDLLIILEHVYFYEKVFLRLVNTGIRPITVVSISMSVFERDDGVNPPHWEDVPGLYLLESVDGVEPLPVHLKDGEQVVIPL